MKDWKNKLKQSLTDEEIQRYLRFLVIPFVALILIVVIVVADRPKKKETAAEPAVSQSQEVLTVEGGGTGDNSQYEMDFSAYELQKDSVPELNALLAQYFQAKKDCDAETLNKVFGGGFSAEALTEKQKKLEDEAVYYEDFQNIVCYTKPGPDTDTYVVYACYDIKFREVDTTAPAMSVCYAKKNAEGAFYFEEQTTGKEAEYIAKMNQTEDVQLLAAQVNASFKTALESDEKLLGVYNVLMKRNEEDQAAAPEGGEESQTTAPEGGEESQAAAPEGGEEDQAAAPEAGQETT